jgi:hypothetical protein
MENKLKAAARNVKATPVGKAACSGFDLASAYV